MHPHTNPHCTTFFQVNSQMEAYSVKRSLKTVNGTRSAWFRMNGRDIEEYIKLLGIQVNREKKTFFFSAVE